MQNDPRFDSSVRDFLAITYFCRWQWICLPQPRLGSAAGDLCENPTGNWFHRNDTSTLCKDALEDMRLYVRMHLRTWDTILQAEKIFVLAAGTPQILRLALERLGGGRKKQWQVNEPIRVALAVAAIAAPLKIFDFVVDEVSDIELWIPLCILLDPPYKIQTCFGHFFHHLGCAHEILNDCAHKQWSGLLCVVKATRRKQEWKSVNRQSRLLPTPPVPRPIQCQ